MTVCNNCGAAVATDEQFCGNCGNFLDWEAQDRAAATAPAASASSETPPPPDSGGTPPQPQTAPAPKVTLPPPTAVMPPMAPRIATVTAPPAGQSPATAVTAPPPVRPGVTAGPAPVRPHRAPQTSAGDDYSSPPPGQPTMTGPVVPETWTCGSCGTPNATTRRFCRKCGTEHVAEAQAAEERVSWWRRLWRRLTGRNERDKKWYDAGHRRPVRRIRIMRILGVTALVGVVLIGIAAFPGRPYVDALVNKIQDRFADHVPIAPAEVRTSSNGPGLLPDNVVDGVADQYWAPKPGDGVGEWVEVEFADPIRLLDIVVSSGASRTQEDFLAQARPQRVDLTMTLKDGSVETEEITLTDQAEPQTFPITVSDVVTVRLTIQGSYGFEDSRLVAIAELEFFTRA